MDISSISQTDPQVGLIIHIHNKATSLSHLGESEHQTVTIALNKHEVNILKMYVYV